MSGEAGVPRTDWRRTSRTGFIVRAIVSLRNLLLPAAALLFGTRGQADAAWVLFALAGMVLLSVFFAWLAWRNFRYRLGESDVRVERGLLSRTARSVPYERIQDVSLEQSLVPRLFDMVEVKFETGGGGKDELKIGYISEAEGAALRETVRARTGSEGVPSRAAGPGPDEATHTLFAMDVKRLALFGLFEFSLVVFAVLAGAAQQFDFLLPFDLWDFERWMGVLAGPGHWLEGLGFAAQALGAAIALAALALVGLVTGLSRTVLRDYGFRLDETPKGLRRRRGLLTRTDAVMPLHRVQALTITTGIVRRRFGWHGLSVVSLAQDSKGGNHIVAPFARMEEIEPVARVTGFKLPGDGADWHRPSARYRADQALMVIVPLVLAALAVPAAAPYLAQDPVFALPVSGVLATMAALVGLRAYFLWRHDRHAIDDRHLFVRRGWLAPRVDIASRLKLQSAEIVQGPLARRRGYATVRFGVAGGELEIRGIGLDRARAIRRSVLDTIAAVDFSDLTG